MHLGVIVNPHAQRVRSPSFVAELESICRSAPHLVYTFCVTHTPEDLDRAMRDFESLGVDVLAPCGGDGTMSATLSSAFRTFGNAIPLVLPLAGGTMNTIARNLGHRERPDVLLQRFVNRVGKRKDIVETARGTLFLRTEGEVPFCPKTLRPRRDAKKATQERVGFLASAAMGARFLAAYSASDTRGLWAASWLGVRTVASCLVPGGGTFARWLFSPMEAKLVVDGEGRPETSYRLVLASTIPDVGLGMKVPWQAGRNPDSFHLVASSLPMLENAKQIPRMLKGEPLVGEPHLDRLVKQARLDFPHSEPLVLDGELFCAENALLTVGPKLRIVAPQGLEPRTLRV